MMTPSGIAALNPNLIVRELRSDEIPSVIKTLESWMDFIQNAVIGTTTEDLLDQFEDSKSVIESISEDLNCGTSEDIFVCENSNSIEGMMIASPSIITDNHFNISDLCSNPKNLISHVSGVGRRLIEKAKELALKKCKEFISLIPLYSSTKFYEKIRFHKSGKELEFNIGDYIVSEIFNFRISEEMVYYITCWMSKYQHDELQSLFRRPEKVECLPPSENSEEGLSVDEENLI